MKNKYVTARIFREDGEPLVKKFGGRSVADAVRNALTEACPHPEADREYNEFTFSANGINSSAVPEKLVGFYCGACKRFVIVAKRKSK